MVAPIERKIKTVLQQDQNVVFAYLFGSMLSGNAGPLSDIDIAVYLFEASFDNNLRLNHELNKETSKEVDIVVLNQIQNIALLKDIMRNGVVITDKEKYTRLLFEAYSEIKIKDFQAHRKYINAQ